MKKLIVLSVVFALVASTAAFAVDLGGTVINTVDLVKSDTGDDSTIDSGASWNRLRIDGGGEAGEGKFGGYFRLDAVHWSGSAQYGGNAWWKPIDQLKLLVGNNGGDGFYGKEGNTGWMFYQTISDNGVGFGGDNVWGGSIYGFGVQSRDAFYGGDGGGDALRLEIRPLDMLGINVNLPFFNGGEMSDVFKSAIFQLDLNLDFGNIALTYVGGEDGNVFVYYGGSFGDLGIDFGFHYDMAEDAPMGVGVGVKYATDAFGLKFRLIAKMAGGDKATKILADVLPNFSLGDNLTAFISVGIGMNMPDGEDSVLGWHFNPYLQVGEEWGAKFLVGIKVSSSGGDDAITKWSIPIALSVGF